MAQSDAAFQIYTTYITGMLAVGVLTTVLAAWAFRRRPANGALWFFWTMALLTLWCVSDAMAVASTTPTWTLAWIRIQLTAAALLPVTWWMLSTAFTKRGEDSRTIIYLLGILPIITVILVWTDSMHGLVFRTVLFPTYGPYTLIAISSRGPWYWVHTAYSYALLILGTGLMINSAHHSQRFYWTQIYWVTLGVALGLAGSVASVLYFAPLHHIDLTPAGFAGAAAALAWALFRHRLFDLVPVARSTMIDRMEDAMFALDHLLRVIELNPAAAGIAGLSVDRSIGRPVGEVLVKCPALVAEVRRLEVGSSGKALDLSCEGREYDVRITALGNGQAQSPGWLIVMHDVSARAAVQRDLQARNEDLDEFSRTVAHDLKTPLTMIVGYADLMADSAGELSPDELSHSASVIRDRALAMSDIIDNLLLLASTRKMEVMLAPLDMAVVVRRACERLNPMIQQTKAEITLPASWPVALGHAAWIEEVWVNYLGNAIKYGGRPPHIILGASESPTDPRMVRFWIQDDGLGISAEDQAKLFAPFTRLDHQSADGHGLGLSIVRRIVQRLGGDVSVSSSARPGEGSIFGFTLRGSD